MKFYDLNSNTVGTKGQQLKSNVKIVFRRGKDMAKEQKERIQPQLEKIASKFKRKKDDKVVVFNEVKPVVPVEPVTAADEVVDEVIADEEE